MKIGIILPNVPNYTETFFLSKIRNLVMAGHDITLFVARKREVFTICKVVQAPSLPTSVVLRIIRVMLYILSLFAITPQVTWRFVKLERKDGNDWTTTFINLYLSGFILLSKLDWLHFGFLSMAVSRENVAEAMGAKMSASLRGYDISRFPLKNRRVYDKTWQKLDKVHTISEALLKKAFGLGMSATMPYQKITPAIDVSYFSSERERGDLGSPLKMLTVARLHWVKGLEYVLEALAKLFGRGIHFEYTIIGDGPEYDRLMFAAYQLGIADNVRFVGRKTHQEVREFMESGDIYIQYSVQEGFSNAVLEAQSMGLLTVVSDAEGLPENVLHNETGWVVPRRDPSALAAQLLELLRISPKMLDQMRGRARARVNREFNTALQGESFNSFYQTQEE
jgi:glycosyltransferase involved in cell wall biosynthesis